MGLLKLSDEAAGLCIRALSSFPDKVERSYDPAENAAVNYDMNS
jgi:hypothetical protein